VILQNLSKFADFSWHSHIEAFISKATKRLYILRQLKRAGVPRALNCFTFVRPVLEYAAPVWHHSLNKSQKNQIEVIHNVTCLVLVLYLLLDYMDLDKRRDLLSHNFFKSIIPCLHNLLQPPCDPELLSRLRVSSKYHRISNRTKNTGHSSPTP